MVKKKYMGILGKPQGGFHHIDIREIPFESYYFALLYFTGSGAFNQRMRAYSKSKGYLLNEYGLYSLDRLDEKRVKGIESERDIFEAIGYKYLEPKDRV